jgi:hypothetical protein
VRQSVQQCQALRAAWVCRRLEPVIHARKRYAHVRGPAHTIHMPTFTQLLAFEQHRPRHNGHKEEAIRRELGITPARYYQLLHRAAATHEGQAANPITAHRVNRRVAKTLISRGY